MVPANNIHVIICDRDTEHLQSIREALSGFGLNISCVSSHIEMKQICDNHKINIALIDTEFNGMGGFATGRKLLKKIPDLIIIYMTNYHKKMDPIKSLFFGGSNFVCRNNKRDLVEKTINWVNILQNSLYAKALIHG